MLRINWQCSISASHKLQAASRKQQATSGKLDKSGFRDYKGCRKDKLL
jgi:hypothetical protein